jgi:dihydrofolate reductase
MSFSIISAHDKNLGIGYKNTIPWYIPNDFKWFKTQTLNKTVIMGMNTYFSLPEKFRPLPQRKNIILCDDTEKSKIIEKEGGVVYTSIEQVINDFRTDDCFVIGGASIYKQFIDLSDKLYITEINKEFECDTFFPVYGNEWYKLYESDVMTNDKEKLNYKFNIYIKKVGNIKDRIKDRQGNIYIKNNENEMEDSQGNIYIKSTNDIDYNFELISEDGIKDKYTIYKNKKNK